MKSEVILKTYSEELKKKVVHDIELGKLSVRGAQRAYGICGSETINKWRSKYGTMKTLVKFQHVSLDKNGDVVNK